MGYVLLEGGAEFGGRMREPDLKAMERAGGFEAPIRIIPTAAAPDNNHQRAGNNGVRWFQHLGARDVSTVPLLSRIRADDKNIAQTLQDAKLIYLLGGFPHYLGQTLKDSLAWQAVIQAWQNGAVIAGSSAGAMVLCEFYYDPKTGRMHEGLSLVPGSLVVPHHNTFGKNWVPRLQAKIPDVTLIGIDEQTGMIDDVSGQWTVSGGGTVTLYSGSMTTLLCGGDSFSL
jgi:cyanophycinase